MVVTNRIGSATICILASLTTLGFSDEWPQFRGPRGDGHVATRLPTLWGESSGVVWKTAIAGKGHSSPVIAGDQIWLTTAISSPLSAEEAKRRLDQDPIPVDVEIAGHLSLRAVCVDRRSGALLHDIEILTPKNPALIHSTNSYASPTSVLHQGRLYCHFGTYGSACIDTSTREILWTSTELETDHSNGPGSSPILWRDLLIAHYDGIDTQSIAAIHIHDGTTAWRTARSGEMDANLEFRKAYATPVIVETDRGTQLISPAANWVYGYDPASGKELWRAGYGDLGFSTVPRPVIGQGLAYICTSFPKSRLMAVRYDGRGDVSETHIAWTSNSQISKKPSPLLIGDALYVLSDGGIVTCFDAVTGEQNWRERIAGNYSASPIVSGHHIYFFSEEGTTTVIRAGQQYEEVAVNQLDGGFKASPAGVDGAIFPRSETHLYRIEDVTSTDDPQP
jgi:hypothetical protein